MIKGTGELSERLTDIINREDQQEERRRGEEERHHKKNKNAARGARATMRVPTAEGAELVFGRRDARCASGTVAASRSCRGSNDRRSARMPAGARWRARSAAACARAGDFAEDDEGDDADVCEYQFVLGYAGVRRQQRERAERAEAVAAAARRRRRRRACFNPAASKRRRKQQAAMEVAIEAPLTIVHEPLFPDAAEAEETHAIAADADGNVAENDEPAAKPAVGRDWESGRRRSARRAGGSRGVRNRPSPNSPPRRRRGRRRRRGDVSTGETSGETRGEDRGASGASRRRRRERDRLSSQGGVRRELGVDSRDGQAAVAAAHAFAVAARGVDDASHRLAGDAQEASHARVSAAIATEARAVSRSLPRGRVRSEPRRREGVTPTARLRRYYVFSCIGILTRLATFAS